MSYTKAKQVKLKEWFNSLTPEQIKKIAISAVEELIETEILNYYPENKDEDAPKGPYWDTTGDVIGFEE